MQKKIGNNQQEITQWEQLLRIVKNDQELAKEMDEIFEGIGFCIQRKISFSEFSLFMCFEHPVEYPSTFVRECQVFISHCVSRLETLDEKMGQKNPLNFVISPQKVIRSAMKTISVNEIKGLKKHFVFSGVLTVT